MGLQIKAWTIAKWNAVTFAVAALGTYLVGMPSVVSMMG